MKRSMLFLVGILLTAPTAAWAEGWQKSADLGLNFNQASYNDAWTGGESGSIAWTFVGNLSAEKALSPRYNWRNTLKLSYGQTHTQREDDAKERHWLSPEKSSDRIFFESLLRMTLGLAVDPYASFTFESQFYDASVPEVVHYIDPMTLSEALGVGRTLVKNEQAELLSRLGFSLRHHIWKDVLSIDPEETETNTTTDGGLEWVTDYAQTFSGEKMKYVSKLRVFKALFNSKVDDFKGLENEDYWKTPDVAWENTLSASVSKYIQVSLFAELLYDKEVDLRGRFREVLGLGVAYKLF
ncbi:MAG: DUF3078 domain-containing protein [Candidatus Eisenbacteria sp.]|nr:DUF3078 domain-containing protein [Candidatus Eisenbacteria bacterium]